MTEQQTPKPAPTREDFNRAHRICANNGHSCECGPRQGEWFTCIECRAAETIKAYADAKEAEIVALRERLSEARRLLDGACPPRRDAYDSKAQWLAFAQKWGDRRKKWMDAGEGGA